MSIDKSIMNKAMKIIDNRRNMAKTRYDLHFEEINSRIPEIAEINAKLAKTGMEILAVIKDGKSVAERISDMKEKNLQAQKIVKALLRENGYPEDYLEIKYTCEKCCDRGFTDNHRCSCLDAVVAKLAAENMNSNSKIKLYSFDTFKIDYYMGTSSEETAKYRETMSKILNYCVNYADNFSRSSKSILMFGGTGLGKTHLSLSIANEVIKKGYSVLYDSIFNYLKQIEKEHFGRAEEDKDTLEMLNRADLVILDDLGTEFEKPFYTPTIYDIINTRLNRGLPTIISTNLDFDGVLKRYDDRITSRLFAIYDNLGFVGTDVRLVQKKIKGE